MIFLSLSLAALFSFILYWKTYPEISQKKRVLLFFLRLITLWIILSFLLIPIYKVTRISSVKPEAIVLIDTSQSMDLLQENQAKSDIVQAFLDDIEDDLEDNFEVDYNNFAASLNGKSNDSNLLKSIEELYSLSSGKQTEIFLFSDGYFSNSEFSKLKNYPYKINTFKFSNQEVETEPKLLNIRSNRSTFLNDPTPIEITSNSHGNKGLYIEIKDKETTLLSQKLDTKDDDISKDIFRLKFDEVGLYELTISLKDTNQEYDTAKLVIKVSDDKNNVVILTDSPDWDIKYIKDAIKLDTRLKYKYIIAKDRTFWEGEKEISLKDALEECQLLILNNENRLILNSNDSNFISNKIDNGLSLFLIGNIINGLDEYYPVNKTDINRDYEGKIIPGLAAKSFSTFDAYLKGFQDLPPVKYNYYALKNSGQEIATLDNMERSPAITYHQLNQAKILHFGFSDFWRFAMRHDSRKYQELILNIAQWLSSKSGENFLVSTDKDGYYFGQRILFNASLLDEKGDFVSQKKLNLQVTNADGELIISDFLLWKSDRYTYELADLSPGNYRYVVTDSDSKQQKEGNLVVFDNSLEQSHLDFNNVALHEIASVTSGQVYDSEDINTIKEKLVRERIPTNLYHEFKILYNNYFLLLVILSFALELYFRRRWGLL